MTAAMIKVASELLIAHFVRFQCILNV